MSNKAVQQLVHDRLSDLGAIAPPSSHPISIRIDPCTVAQLDVLAHYLGYGGRSQLVRDLIDSSLEDLILEVRKALKDDVLVSAEFKAQMHQALEAR